MSDSKFWGRHGPGVLQMNALTVPVGEKINYFTPAGTVRAVTPYLLKEPYIPPR